MERKITKFLPTKCSAVTGFHRPGGGSLWVTTFGFLLIFIVQFKVLHFPKWNGCLNLKESVLENVKDQNIRGSQGLPSPGEGGPCGYPSFWENEIRLFSFPDYFGRKIFKECKMKDMDFSR